MGEPGNGLSDAIEPPMGARETEGLWGLMQRFGEVSYREIDLTRSLYRGKKRASVRVLLGSASP